MQRRPEKPHLRATQENIFIISNTYNHLFRKAADRRSRISSPPGCFLVKDDVLNHRPKVPKSLTNEIWWSKNSRGSASICWAFPGDSSHFDPVFPHLSGHKPRQSVPKILTFGENQVIWEAAGPANRSSPEFTHLSESRAGRPFDAMGQILHGNGPLLPQRLTLCPRMLRIQAEMRPQPRKASPSVRVLSRLASPMAFTSSKQGRKARAETVPKALTFRPAALGTDFRAPPRS